MKTKNRTNFFYYCLKGQNKRKYFITSLLIVLSGIFLLPKFALLSSVTEENIINLTNRQRLENGLAAVTANQLLAEAAHEKGQEIFAYQSFKHTINDNRFSYWIKGAGYEYSYVGENLAIDFYTAEGVIKAWLDSPTHRKNVLNENFKEIGVAVLEDEFAGQKSILVVQIFGSPKTAASPAETPLLGPLSYTYNNPLQNLFINNENLLTHALTSGHSVLSTPDSFISEDAKKYNQLINIRGITSRITGLGWNQESAYLIFIYLLIFSVTIILAAVTSEYGQNKILNKKPNNR